MVNNLSPFSAAADVRLSVRCRLIFHSDSLFPLKKKNSSHLFTFICFTQPVFPVKCFMCHCSEGNKQRADLSFEAPYDRSAEAPLLFGWIGRS